MEEIDPRSARGRSFDLPDAAFRLPGYSFDASRLQATFRYVLELPGDRLQFEEVVTLPAPASVPSDETLAIVDRVLALLYVTAGVSYYKIAAPRVVDASSADIAEGAHELLRDIYRRGLGEFAYVNQLSRVLDVDVRLGVAAPAVRRSPSPDAVPLVPIGGGKDSIVTAEALRVAGREPVLFAVNPNRVILDVLERFPGRSLQAKRRLDPLVLELNKSGAFNGHVPVTAINSLIAIATATLHGLGEVVMSNEHSASEANVTWNGVEINHQWSKSLDAEKKLRAAVAAHAGLDAAYASALRPFSELEIARLFAATTDYDDVVTSCNAAFRPGSTVRWCCDCPKCRFVFLALAVSMPPKRLVGIFGRDMLDDPSQLDGYKDLVGLGPQKPFECVGEIDESRSAIAMLASDPEWKDAAVVRELAPALGSPSAISFFRTAPARDPGHTRYVADVLAFAEEHHR